MGFETLPTAIDQSEALTPLAPKDTAFEDEKLADAKALGIVINDLGFAERYVGSKARPQEWNDIDNTFRAIVAPQKWEGSNAVRAHLGMPLVLEVIESMMPQIHLAFFSDRQPFTLTAKGQTTQAAARATAKVVNWNVKESGFKEETRKVLKSCLQYGTGVGKWGWQKETRSVKSYSKENGAIISTAEDKECQHATFDYIDLRNLLVDPSVRTSDIRNAKYVIRQWFVTANQLDEMRDDDKYKNIPTREQLKELLALNAEPAVDSMTANKVENFRTLQAERQVNATSSDPLQQPLEILEYESADRVITVLQKKIVIQNDANEWDRISYVSCAFIDVLGSFFGLGIGKLLEGEQVLEQGVVNAWIDSLNLTLSPAFFEEKGVASGAQNVSVAPGKIIRSTGPLKPVEVQSVTAEALQAIQTSEARARRRVGANFGPDMPTQAMRTAEGVNEFTSGIQVRTQYFVEIFADFVFIPVLEAFIEMSKDNLTPKDIDGILTDAEGKDYDGDHLEIYNGSYQFEVLTSTKLAAKRAMVSMVPLMMQMFAAAPVQQAMVTQNKKLDMVEFISQTLDLAGWDAPGLIVDMTPEDMQRAMAQNPAVQRTQGDMMLQQQKAQDDQTLEQVKGDIRGGVVALKTVLDSAKSAHDALNQPPTQPLATRGEGD